MIGHTACSTGEKGLLIAGSLGVNFLFLKNFEEERHKLIQIPGLNFLILYGC